MKYKVNFRDQHQIAKGQFPRECIFQKTCDGGIFDQARIQSRAIPVVTEDRLMNDEIGSLKAPHNSPVVTPTSGFITKTIGNTIQKIFTFVYDQWEITATNGKLLCTISQIRLIF